MLCDDLNNARTDVMHEIADGYAHVLWTFANMDEITPTQRRLSQSLSGDEFQFNSRHDDSSRFYQGAKH